MTKEERYASIYSHDIVYCPPMEEESALLEVALGCSWSKCLFCDFARDKFYVHSMEKIEENLQVLSEVKGEKDRVFFLGENTFCLPSRTLLEITLEQPLSKIISTSVSVMSAAPLAIFCTRS